MEIVVIILVFLAMTLIGTLASDAFTNKKEER